MGMRSNNFVGLPVLAGMMMVIPNVIIHVMTLDFIMCGLGVTWFAEIMKNKILNCKPKYRLSPQKHLPHSANNQRSFSFEEF